MNQLVIVIVSVLSAGVVSAAPSVELDLVPSARASLSAPHDWVRALSGLDSVRVRAVRTGNNARPKVSRSGDVVHITAVIGSQNELVVPGRKFTLRQQSALRTWIEQQRSGESESGAPTKDRFGLSAAELKELHEALKAPVSVSTQGINARRIVSVIENSTKTPIELSSAAKEILNGAQAEAELKDFSAGTALAALLRPLELVLAPKASSRGTQLEITREGMVAEAWPIGWPSPQRDRDVVPKLFDFLEIEIDATPIADVLSAVGPRLGTPILYDTPMLELKKIDPTSTVVSIPAKRTFYGKLLSQSLFQARLDYEVRVDERGKPFLWIFPLVAGK